MLAEAYRTAQARILAVVRSFASPTLTSASTRSGIRISEAKPLKSAKHSIRPRAIRGDALTTQTSFTVDFPYQIFEGLLKGWDLAAIELVEKLGTAKAGDLSGLFL